MSRASQKRLWDCWFPKPEPWVHQDSPCRRAKTGNPAYTLLRPNWWYYKGQWRQRMDRPSLYRIGIYSTRSVTASRCWQMRRLTSWTAQTVSEGGGKRFCEKRGIDAAYDLREIRFIRCHAHVDRYELEYCDRVQGYIGRGYTGQKCARLLSAKQREMPRFEYMLANLISAVAFRF